MSITDIPVIWLTLLFLSIGMLLELLDSKKEIKSYFYLLGALSILFFSLNNLQLCSDHFHYQNNYERFKDEYNLFNLEPDTLFQKLASLWYFWNSKSLNADSFLAFYQMLSLLILVISVYFCGGKWKNTILFISLFGSFQLHSLTICSLRQGLASSITIILFIFVIQSQSKGYLLTSRSSLLYQTFLVLLSINAHWTSIIITPIFYFYPTINKALSKHSRKVIWLFSILVILFVSLSVILIYLYDKIFLYAEGIDGMGSLGGRIHFTAIMDIVLLCICSFTGRTQRKEGSVPNVYMQNLQLMSILLVALKMMTFSGFGVAIRIVMGLNIIQIICFQAILEKVNVFLRILIIFGFSAPYIFFIFFAKTEVFKPV